MPKPTEVKEGVRNRADDLEKEIEHLTQTLTEVKNKQTAWKDKFISSVSHDFRTPLSTIKLTANYLMKYRDRLDSGAIDEKLKVVTNQVDNLLHALDNLATQKDNEESRIAASKSVLDIVEFFRGLIAETEARFNRRIIADINVSSRQLNTDEELLRHVLFNLIGNAIKFSPGKPTVSIKLTQKEDVFDVEIADDGIGIEPEDLPFIFDAFYRGRNSGGIDGMGLGLSMVKRGVDALNGKIEVVSLPSRGTTVRIAIPAK